MLSYVDEEMLQDFVAECREHLSAIEPDLLAMEKDGAHISAETINHVFRAIHSIKGLAGFFGLDSIKTLSHVMESVLMLVRDGKLSVTPELMDPLFSSVDLLKAMVDDVATSNDVDISGHTRPLAAILERSKSAGPIMVASLTDQQVFEVSSEALQSTRRQGLQLFQVKAYLHRDIHAHWASPIAFLNKVFALGDCLETHLDFSEIGSLEDCLDQDAILWLLVATSMEAAELALSLQVPTAGVHQLSPQAQPGELADDLVSGLASEQGRDPLSSAPSAKTKTPKKANSSAGKKTNAPATRTAPVPPDTAPALKATASAASGTPALPSAASGTPALPSAASGITTTALARGLEGSADGRPEPAAARPSKDGSGETLRIRVDLLTTLMNLAGELVLGRNQLMRALADEARESGLGAILQNINQVTTSLQEGIMQTRMQPADSIFSRFPRIIRDMAKQLGKQIDLEIQGSEVELDKSLVELLTDPLTHIIRNSADHAIEMPEERVNVGKPPLGRIVLRAYHQDGHVNISIQDDGKGIDAARVGQKAVEKGIITQAEKDQMTEGELVNLIFAPGFSTADTVSDMSGRGVGMDVVRSNTEKMGGTVEVSTTPGRGTTILLRLPLTLAIIPSMIVGVADQRFAIPQVHVVEFVSVSAAELDRRVERVNDAEVLRLRDRLLPLVKLAEVLKISPQASEDRAHPGTSTLLRTAPGSRSAVADPAADYQIVVLQVGSNQFGAVVDELFDIEEIVVKPPSVFAQNIKCFSGATIVGDGHVIMILDVGGLVALAGLRFADLQAENKRRSELESQSAAVAASRLRPIILCTAAPDEYFAIPQESILRLEMFPKSSIHHVGNQEFVTYRGRGLPLIRLESHINVNPVDPELKELFVVIPKVIREGRVAPAQAGIVISNIIDAMEVDVKLDAMEVATPGVLGSAVLQDSLTLFLKPSAFLDRVDVSKEASL